MNVRLHLSACEIETNILYPFEDSLTFKFRWFDEKKVGSLRKGVLQYGHIRLKFLVLLVCLFEIVAHIPR
jgi:hypothetical protein